jgi:uncharacterized tellurite resistance protein B-like protein
MISKIKDFFDQQFSEKEVDSRSIDEKINLAAAALLIEISYSDHDISTEEKETLKRLLQEKFEIAAHTIHELVALAELEVREASSAHEFTRLINSYFEKDQKYQLVQAMWEIAFADGNLDLYEEAMIRKLADLLHVSHSNFIRAKLSIQENL